MDTVCLPDDYVKSQVWLLSAVRSSAVRVETGGSLELAGCQPSELAVRLRLTAGIK